MHLLGVFYDLLLNIDVRLISECVDEPFPLFVACSASQLMSYGLRVKSAHTFTYHVILARTQTATKLTIQVCNILLMVGRKNGLQKFNAIFMVYSVFRFVQITVFGIHCKN